MCFSKVHLLVWRRSCPLIGLKISCLADYDFFFFLSNRNVFAVEDKNGAKSLMTCDLSNCLFVWEGR